MASDQYSGKAFGDTGPGPCADPGPSPSPCVCEDISPASTCIDILCSSWLLEEIVAVHEDMPMAVAVSQVPGPAPGPERPLALVALAAMAASSAACCWWNETERMQVNERGGVRWGCSVEGEISCHV